MGACGVAEGQDKSNEGKKEEVRAVNNWQVIETAPKDGTEILVYNDDGEVYQASWKIDRWRLASAGQHGCGCCGGDAEFPTHWMPLPAPPTEI